MSISACPAPSTRGAGSSSSWPATSPSVSLIAQNIRSAFRHGVLAVRDGGDAHGHVLRYMQENEGRGKDPVLVKTAGRAWHQPGRYGSMLGRHPGGAETLASAFAQGPDPVDQVKVVNSGPNSLRAFARETPPQFTVDEMKELVRLAGQRGRKVMVHANGELPVRLALEAGCHSIEHGYFMGRENLALMAEKGAVWVPTLAAMKSCAEHLDAGRREKRSGRCPAHPAAPAGTGGAWPGNWG